MSMTNDLFRQWRYGIERASEYALSDDKAHVRKWLRAVATTINRAVDAEEAEERHIAFSRSQLDLFAQRLEKGT